MIDPFFMKGGFVLEGRDPFVLPEHFHIVFFIMEAAGICGFFDADITSLKEHLGNLNTAPIRIVRKDTPDCSESARRSLKR